MSQTAAIFLDAYRRLNANKLFWLTLGISGLVVIAFACVGFNERGVKLLVWQFDTPSFNSKTLPPADFYKLIFVNGGIGFWLSWLASILALISTAGIFPELIGSGAIDLFVSRPLSRLRLFITEYTAGLLFVTLQVSIFSLASFLVIGLRGGAWEPGLLVAVPVVVCFFSYLFAVCVLLGVLTRSTVAALLLTLLFWFLVYALGAAEQSVLMFQTMEKHSVTFRAHPRGASGNSAGQDDGKGSNPTGDGAAPDGEQSNSESLERAHRILHAIMTVLPKTTETISLLQRWLVSLANLQPQPANSQEQGMVAAQQELKEKLDQRSPLWIIGTSLAFEFVVLAWAAWIFCRRDY